MVTCQIRLVDEDALLETRELEAVPGIGEEIVIGGQAYQTAAPPSDIIDNTAVVYVRKVSEA